VSVPIGLDRLRQELGSYRMAPYLVTVNDDGRPHAVAIAVGWDGGALVTRAGSRSLANLVRRPQVTLLWPPSEPDGYSLIVDGMASTISPADDRVTVEPVSAVLHRLAPPVPGQPVRSDCVSVLRR